MTDPELIAKRLALIETCVRELRELSVPEALEHDVKEERFVEHTLQIAIQAALDVASHVVSDERLGEPTTNAELFTLLERGGHLASPVAAAMKKAAGFRNVLVHGYAAVNPSLVRDVLENHLDDLLDFVRALRSRLSTKS